MLEEKVEALTAEVVKLRQVMEKALPAITSATSSGGDEDGKPAKKTAAAKKPAAAKKAKAVEPEHDADEVAAIMRKAAKEVDKAAVQKYIAEQECEDLAELLTKPELLDPAYDFAAGLLPNDEEEESEDDDI